MHLFCLEVKINRSIASAEARSSFAAYKISCLPEILDLDPEPLYKLLDSPI